MRSPGQIVLFPFPHTDQVQGRLRPALLLGKLPGPYDDWLICMVSSQLHHHLADFDEIIDENSPDFVSSGLKRASAIRIGRLAVVDASILLGAIGTIATERLQRIKTHLADWLSNA